MNVVPSLSDKSENKIASELFEAVVEDVKKLVRHELQLARSEASRDWVRAKNAFALFMGAYILIAVGIAFALAFYAQLLVSVGFSVGTSYLLVAGLLIGSGIASYLLAKWWFKSLSVFPKPGPENGASAT